jgi:hypothetical protein
MKKPKPTRKVAAKWRRRHVECEALAGVPFVICLLAGAFWSPWIFFVALGFFVWGFTMQRQRFRKCTCETCGAELRREMKDDAPIEFYCESCNCVWTTTLIQDGVPG